MHTAAAVTASWKNVSKVQQIKAEFVRTVNSRSSLREKYACLATTYIPIYVS